MWYSIATLKSFCFSGVTRICHNSFSSIYSEVCVVNAVNVFASNKQSFTNGKTRLVTLKAQSSDLSEI